MKAAVTIEIDTDALPHVTDAYLAQCWHAAQANPAPTEDDQASELVEKIGWEIVRRWLKEQPPELYQHQAKDRYWGVLRTHGHWIDDGKTWVPNGAGEIDRLQQEVQGLQATVLKAAELIGGFGRQSHADAFVVAKAAAPELLADVRNAVERLLASGAPLAEAMPELAVIVDRHRPAAAPGAAA